MCRVVANRSAEIVYNQNHPRPQRRDIPVVVLQGGDGGVVRGGDRKEGFAALDPVTQNRVCRCCGGMGSGGRVVRSGWMIARNLHLARAPSNGKMEIQDPSSGEAAAFQVVPDAKHPGGVAEILRDRFNCIEFTY